MKVGAARGAWPNRLRRILSVTKLRRSSIAKSVVFRYILLRDGTRTSLTYAKIFALNLLPSFALG